MPDFKVVSDFKPTGDQPQAIEKLVDGVRRGLKHQTLLGVTGSGKTATMAHLHREGYPLNEDIDRLRHAAVQPILNRRDTLVVASVSCIYGLGAPEDYGQAVVSLRRGKAASATRSSAT